MKQIIQKTKKVMQYRVSNWLIGFFSFVGVLAILVLNLTGDINLGDKWVKIAVAFVSLSFFISFFYEYFVSHRTSNALTDLTKTINDIETDMAVSLSGQDDSYYIMAISNILNQSLYSLKDKNIRLESEMERNKRLSENINEFYRQMKSLRETDFKFDFFEYEVKQEFFVFITGLVTFIETETDITEITIDDLFGDFQFSIKKEEFRKHVKRCVDEDEPLNFECSVSSGGNAPHWLKFWGRACEDKTRITGAITEITREVLQRNLEKERAIHDNITGFYNRNALSEIGGKAISDNKPGEMAVFVYSGLTGYQEFQERYGMVAGNTYIRAFAELFKKFVNDQMIPFRWWGSDFLFILRGVSDLDGIIKSYKNIMRKIEKYMSEVDGIAVSFPVTNGYAVSGLHGDTPSELLEYASFAQHEALRGLDENPNPFNRERFEEVKRAALRRTFIKDIIDKNQLSVVFQPIVSLKTGELIGYEALSRPLNPIYRSIVELIDDAEASGHYIILEKRMVYNALDAYMLRNEKYKDHYLFINTAPYATLDEKDYNDIRDRYFGHMRVVFEVVERNRMEPEEINLRKSIVTKAGAKFALDDFGSGYSNHLALLSLEPDIIKLDKELVRGIHNDMNKQCMLEDIISYSRYRGTRVLAEGIETRDELETLYRMGVDYAQGFYLGMPLPQICDPDEKALEVIKTMSKRTQINLKHIFILLTEAFSLMDEDLSRNTALTTFLVTKMADRLGIEGEHLNQLIVAALMHDVGALFPDCRSWKKQDNEKVPGHCIIAYLIMKEFSPYPDLEKLVLYHHSHYAEKNRSIHCVRIPDEAYLISLAEDVSQKLSGFADQGEAVEKILADIDNSLHHPEQIGVMKELLNEGILASYWSGDYKELLMDYLNGIIISKADVESIFRIFIYTIMMRTSTSFYHTLIMETTVDMMARLTRQNWRLIEKIRISALVYNLSRLEIQYNEPHSLEDEKYMIRQAMPRVVEIIRKAGLLDIMEILNPTDGEDKTFLENNVLMGKDIIMGSKMIILSDRLASLLEDKSDRAGLSCAEAIDELKKESNMESGFLPILEALEDYAEDIDAKIAVNKASMEKDYPRMVQHYKRLKERISGQI